MPNYFPLFFAILLIFQIHKMFFLIFGKSTTIFDRKFQKIYN